MSKTGNFRRKKSRKSDNWRFNCYNLKKMYSTEALWYFSKWYLIRILEKYFILLLQSFNLCNTDQKYEWRSSATTSNIIFFFHIGSYSTSSNYLGGKVWWSAIWFYDFLVSRSGSYIWAFCSLSLWNIVKILIFNNSLFTSS